MVIATVGALRGMAATRVRLGGGGVGTPSPDVFFAIAYK